MADQIKNIEALYQQGETIHRPSLYPKWQAYSGIAFSTFTAMHLFNHFINIFGDNIEGHTRWMTLFRNYYQSPIIECGLAGALVVHAYCAVRQIQSRPKLVPEGLPLSHKLHRYCGYFLFAAIGGHIYATRIGPIRFFQYSKSSQELDSTFITWTLREFGTAFYVYYTLLYACGMYHSLFGLYYSAWILKTKRPISSNSSVWKWLAGISDVTGGLVALSFGGKFYNIEIPKQEVYAALKRSLLFMN